MLDEYDFSSGVRGKYAQRYEEGCNVVVLDPDLAEKEPGEPSEAIKHRVQAARVVQLQRFSQQEQMFANSQMETQDLHNYCQLDRTSTELLKSAMEKLGLSARAYDRILKVSRTIADLENAVRIEPHHLSEAIQYRSLDRQMWLQ